MSDSVNGQTRDIAAAVASLWVRSYTGWVGAEAAERRRAEIASDVWEQRIDALEKGGPRFLADLSIVRRVVAGFPDDLLWVRTQRLTQRGLRVDGKEHRMNRFVRILAGWWWVALAAGFVVYILTAAILGLTSGSATGSGQFQAFALAAVLALGVAFRARFPRISASLVVSGGFIFLFLWFLPVTWVISFPMVAGAAVFAIRLTSGGVWRRVAAALGLLFVGAAWLIPGVGFPLAPALLGAAGSAVVGVILLAITAGPSSGASRAA